MDQTDSEQANKNFKDNQPDGSLGKVEKKNPFKFLDSYTQDDREIFFGREQELDEIYRKFYKSKILLVYGKSGTGKSSIINCGLVSRIPAEDILIVPVRCGKDPVGNLKADLRKFSDSDSSDILDILQDIHEKNFKPVSLIFDQFEEIFILSTPEERKKLISELLKLIQSKIRVNLVLIFREEYFAGFSEFEDDIPNLYANRVRIEKLSKHFVEEIIEKPCKNCQVKVEPGLSKKIADLLSKETGEIELTWFQILMDKLYKLALEKNETDPEIRISDLDQVGDIGNLLGDFLNEQLLGMEDSAQVEAVLKTMISEDGTKRQITFEEIIYSVEKSNQAIPEEKVWMILKSLVDRRIISEKDEHGYYEIKHDSLALRIYERLTAEERKLKEIQQLIRNAHKQYLQVGTLMNEQTLKYVDPYLSHLSLPSDQEKFVKHSENEIGKTRKRKRKILVVSSIVLIAILVAFSTWALFERTKAIKQTRFASKQKEIAEEQKTLAERQTELAVQANEFAEMAKDTAIRAKEIVENELYGNIRNSLSVSPLNMNVLYIGIDNPVSIAASGIAHDKIFPYCYDAKNREIKATIIREKNDFIVRDINRSTSELIIGAYGITNNGDKLDLGSQLFRVKRVPAPTVSIGKNKLTGGNISIEDLAEVEQLDLNIQSDYKLNFEITGFSLALIINGDIMVYSSRNKFLQVNKRG